MKRFDSDHQQVRGFLQSDDGIITTVTAADKQAITFQTAFKLPPKLIVRLKNQPHHFIFSERSRIARLGIHIKCESPSIERLDGDTIQLELVASPMITGYPKLSALKDFFTTGLPVGRLVFCDPKALLSANEVLQAIESAELKLPAATTISSDGSIVIAPHRVVCKLKEPLSDDILNRILFREDGRAILNRYQTRQEVAALTIPPGEGIITTCSMFLNDHYVVLQSGTHLGKHLPATILDPIKTRGIRIYLEIANESRQPIVNPLISAKIYQAPRAKAPRTTAKHSQHMGRFSFTQMKTLEKRLDRVPSTCHYLSKPVALIQKEPQALKQAKIYINGPEKACTTTKAACATNRKLFSPASLCQHVYSTAKIKKNDLHETPVVLALKYFPNILEHIDIIKMAGAGRVQALYFFEPSCDHGLFLSQFDHNRLQEYAAFGIDIFWVSSLTRNILYHTMRDGKGYFVAPDKLAYFQKSMLFAFYGSNRELSPTGIARLGSLMDALIAFWGKNIGIVTGGGSGVMEMANTLARERGILSGANFLDITDQSMTTDVDFCQVFQDTCRHSRQKWFEVASFPIFNVGGLGSLEELGITLCNMKLAILDPVPIILFDTEGDGSFWKCLLEQIHEMIRLQKAPEWVSKNLVITNDPQTVIAAYRDRLKLF